MRTRIPFHWIAPLVLMVCVSSWAYGVVTATPVSHTRIDLVWDAVPAEAIDVLVDRKATGLPGGFTTIASLPPSTLTYIDTGLTGSIRYTYRVAYTYLHTNGKKIKTDKIGDVTVSTLPAPVAHYTFDGQSASDVSGNGAHGTVLGNPVWAASADGGGGFYFDGVDDVVSIGEPASLEITGAITIETWVMVRSYCNDGWHPDNLVVRGHKVGVDAATSGETSLRLSQDGYAEVAEWLGGTLGITATDAAPMNPTPVPVSIGNWVHLLGTYDPASGMWFLYRDGILVGQSNPGAVGARIVPGAAWALGGRCQDGQIHRLFNGMLDDVRIYDVTADAAFAAGRASAPPADVAPVITDMQATSFGTEGVLSASIFDDGQSAVDFTWSVVAKPSADAVVTFTDGSAATTEVFVSQKGVYTFRLATGDATGPDKAATRTIDLEFVVLNASALPLSGSAPGHHYDFVVGTGTVMPNFDAVTSLQSGLTNRVAPIPTDGLGYPSWVYWRNLATRYQGYLYVETTGTYRFELDSDDAARLIIDGREIVAVNQNHGAIAHGGIGLEAGLHPFTLEYLQINAVSRLTLRWDEGVRGAPYSAIPPTHLRHALLPTQPELVPGEPGLSFSYFDFPTGTFLNYPKLPDMSAIVPSLTGVVPTIDTSPALNWRDHGFVYEGLLDAPESGMYLLTLDSDDNARLYVDGMLVVDGDVGHGQWAAQTVGLETGLHEIRVEYIQYNAVRRLDVLWRPPSSSVDVPIPAGNLYQSVAPPVGNG